MFKKIKIPYLNVLPVLVIAFFLYKLVSETKVSINGILEGIYACIAYFVWGFVFAYILNPALVFIEKLIESKKDSSSAKKLKRAGVIAFIYLIFAGIITLFIVAVLPTIRKGVTEIIDKIPLFATGMEQWVSDFTNSFDPTITSTVEIYIKSWFEVLYGWLSSVVNFSTIGGVVTAAVSGSAMAVIRIVFGVVVSVYFLYSKENIIVGFKKLLYAIFSEKHTEKIIETSREINVIFMNYIVSKLLQSFIMFIIGLLVLAPLGIPYAPLISFIIAITNMIPYFGPYIGAIPCILLVLFFDPIKALWTLIYAIGVQIVDNMIVGPKVMSDTVGISPLYVIAGVTIGGKFGGILGMFLGVPLVAVFKLVFYDKFIANRLHERGLNNKNLWQE